VATPDNRLWALDARDGKPCAGFGDAGAVDLRAGLGDVPPGSYGVTSPPVVSHGRLVVGARVADNVSIDMPSGVVRAYDAKSGALAWAWDIGRPDRSGAPAAGETYTRSTPNAWAPLVADDVLGLVYLPTGNPAADYFGGHRRAFDNEYGASLVAVDIQTGHARWHFQATHHDIWDNDLSAQPVLVDLPGPQGPRHAVIFGTKQGNLFVLDRATGEPIVPVSEQLAPQPSRIGEALAATQPASALAVNPGPALLTEAHMWGLTPIDQMWCRIQFRRARYEGPYTPPGTDQATIAYPGMFGGIEWSGITVDPVRRILVANPNAMPFIVRMAAVPGGTAAARGTSPASAAAPRGPEGLAAGMVEMRGTGYAVSYYALLSPLKIPCLQPPWGELVAIDLDTRQVLWHRPVGTIRDTGPWGIASRLPVLIGTPQVGGSIVTAGGLVFAAGTLDQYLRAYELGTGRELWRARLPAGGQATPMTYEVDGRQYVVIAAGGHSVLGTRSGDYIMAFALPATAGTRN
jgi:quinoprotein glucose dehydrogenase